MPEGWEWDETLYLGSAPYYARGRLPYAPALADRLADVLDLDGEGRLVDVGCGPGILALSFAHLFAEVVGVDPDAGMLAEGERRAAAAGIGNVRWLRARAEELPAELGPVRVATFGQSFHWMDRERVVAIVLGLLEPGGVLVHVSDRKDAPDEVDAALPHPTPPFAEMRELVKDYLGPVQRAGQGMLRYGSPDGEAMILRAAGYAEPEHLRVPAGGAMERSEDDLVAWVYSLSGSAPHLFGDRRGMFERELRAILRRASPSGWFSEQPPDTEVFVWRKPAR
jgi:SAM-dependent methyltransferase